MPDPSNAITVTLALLGAGTVVPGIQPELLLPADANGVRPPRVSGPPCAASRNLRLLDGVLATRPGYLAVGTAPDANRITGAFTAVFDTGLVRQIRCTATTVHAFDGTTYTDITGAAAFTATENDYWCFAMVPRVGVVSPKNQLFLCNGVDGVYLWTGTGNIALVAAAPGGTRVLLSHHQRAYAMNVLLTGARRSFRIHRSIIGDPTDWTGIGSGFVDVDGDPYPINGAVAFPGGFWLLKGDRTGGSIWTATPTGLVNDPDAYAAMNPDADAGLLLRRSVIQLPDGTIFFVGHDGLYLLNTQSAKRVAYDSFKATMRTINQNALDAPPSWYKPRTTEIHIGLATGGATLLNEVWVYNVAEERLYGPYTYADTITAATPFVSGSTLDWTAFSYPGGWSMIPFSTWSAISAPTPSTAPTMILGTSTGLFVADGDVKGTDDNGVEVQGSYDAAAIRADGRVIGQKQLDDTDMLTLYEVVLDYVSGASWAPLVEVTTDGGATWTVVSDGADLPSGNGELVQKSYSTLLTSSRFQPRLSGDHRMRVHSIRFRFTYAGDVRHG